MHSLRSLGGEVGAHELESRTVRHETRAGEVDRGREVASQILPSNDRQRVLSVALQVRDVRMLSVDEIGDVVNRSLDGHPEVIITGVLVDFVDRPRLVEVGAQ